MKNSNISSLMSQEKLEQLAQDKARELFERHKEEVTKQLVYERFETEVRTIASEIARRAMEDMQSTIQELQWQILFYQDKAAKAEKELAALKEQYRQLCQSKQEIEHERDNLVETNQGLLAKLEEYDYEIFRKESRPAEIEGFQDSDSSSL
jgi:chromosome segregation ATPase